MNRPAPDSTTNVVPTLTPAEAAGRHWPVVVVGAGPAGSVLALEMARRGVAVLLVDRAMFPRGKVCGGCLGGTALGLLERLGLGDLPGRLGAVPAKVFRLAAGGRWADLPLRRGAALSRERLDAALVVQAVTAGAAFLPGVSAAASGLEAECRRVELRGPSARAVLEAAVVVLACGLSGRVLEAEVPGEVAAGSFMGVGGRLPQAAAEVPGGMIQMACGGEAGYVGLVRLEDGSLNVAAALAGAFVRGCGGPGPAGRRILLGAGLAVPTGWDGLAWQGTPALTRRRTRLGAARMLAIGDAAGYVEPFSGEGIAWAIGSAMAAADLVEEAAWRWSDALVPQWTQRYRRLFARRQRGCRLLTHGLRSSWATGAAVRLLAHAPRLARPVLAAVARPLAGEPFRMKALTE